MPITRRIPHLKGFKNTRKEEINIVNISQLNKFDENSIIDFNALLKMGLIMKDNSKVKILGNGKLTKKLTVKANLFSKSAIQKIEKAGGKAEEV